MIDPNDLALSGRQPTQKREKAPRHKPGERFLCGPIPMPWLFAAAIAAGHGSGFKVAIALWYLSGLNRKANMVVLSGSVLRDMGVDRHAAYRGLSALEEAGLVNVKRHPGRSPIVTILSTGKMV